ncbi:MAG: BPL-N domain-containing protein [Kiritimatiellae bacterium]|nr:BPL-N domain-containing protein [Kiritimatiellia bacterium]
MKRQTLIVGLVVLFGGLVGADAQTRVPAAGKPVRVAVYTDRGSRSNGQFRWLQFASSVKNFKARAVDGAMVQAGVLDETDLLIMPGGYAIDEAVTLGTNGCAALKAYIARGGAYVGTCAGCYLLMQDNPDVRPYRLGLLPYRDVPKNEKHGRSDVTVEFLPAAKKYGFTSTRREILYSHGPILIPGDPVPEAKFEMVANYYGDFAVQGPEPMPSMSGKGAMAIGMYGKGRVVASCVHPESGFATWDLVRKMLAWATDSKVELVLPRHQTGNLSVGVVADGSYGPTTGDFVMKLIHTPGLDVQPITTSLIAQGYLRRLDALVLPDTVDNARLLKRTFPKKSEARAKLEAFAKAGGLLVGWGAVAREIPGTKVVSDSAAVVKELLARKAEPKKPVVTPKAPTVQKKVRAAVYLGRGGGSPTEARLLEQSPEYEVFYVDGPAIAAGALDKADILIQGGGGGESQFKALGEQGQANLRRFILNGGGYHGTCAGAFMMIEPTRRVRMNMVPYRPDDPDHYRGGADTLLRATEAGKAVLGPKEKYRVCYHGGPALIAPSKPIEGADFKVFLEYDGYMINTVSSKPMLPMAGKGALVGGTCGKGRVVLCGPHPEIDESSDEIFLKTVGWVTGVMPHPVRPWHRRGSVDVGVSTGRETVEGGRLFAELLRDTEINFRPGGGVTSDILVLSNPTHYPPSASRFAAEGRLVVLATHPTTKKPSDLPAIYCSSVSDAVAAVKAIRQKLGRE